MKYVFMVLLFTALVASIAFPQAKPGGIAREAAMGGSQAGVGLVLNPYIFDDPALLLLNPAFQTNYKDYGWSNIAGGNVTGQNNVGYNFQNAGVAFSLNDSWNLGAIFSYDPSEANSVASLTPGNGGNIPPIQSVWELVASTKMSSMSLGFGLLYGTSDKDNKSTVATPAASVEDEYSAHVYGLRAGTLFDLGNGNMLDAAAALRMDKGDVKNTTSPVVTNTNYEYESSGTEFQVDARLKYKVTNKFYFVPFGFLGLASAEPKEDTPPNGQTAATGTDKFTQTAYAIGVGGEVHAQKLFLAGGLSFQSLAQKEEVTSGGANSTTTTYTATYNALPVVNLGAEWSFTDWMVGRLGYFRYIGKIDYKREMPTGTDESSSTQVPDNNYGATTFPFTGVNSGYIGTVGNLNGNYDGIVTLGVGFKFDCWAMDATVSDQALQRGLGLIGGPDNMNTFGYITASYNFAE